MGLSPHLSRSLGDPRSEDPEAIGSSGPGPKCRVNTWPAFSTTAGAGAEPRLSPTARACARRPGPMTACGPPPSGSPASWKRAGWGGETACSSWRRAVRNGSSHSWGGWRVAWWRCRWSREAHRTSSSVSGSRCGRVSPSATAPLRGLNTLLVSDLERLVGGRSAEPLPLPALTRRDLLEIVFTSGTTAEPKGVCLTHGNVLANLEAVEDELRKHLWLARLTRPLRFLSLVPLTHVFGQIAAVFVPPGWSPPAPLPALAQDERDRGHDPPAVGSAWSSPSRASSSCCAMRLERDWKAQGVLEARRAAMAAAESRPFWRRRWMFRDVHRRFGGRLLVLATGGATLARDTEAFWRRLGFLVVQGYGMTETAALITLVNPFKATAGSLGGALPGTEVRIDERGQVMVRGANGVARLLARRPTNLSPIAKAGWPPATSCGRKRTAAFSSRGGIRSGPRPRPGSTSTPPTSKLLLTASRAARRRGRGCCGSAGSGAGGRPAPPSRRGPGGGRAAGQPRAGTAPADAALARLGRSRTSPAPRPRARCGSRC